MIDAQTFLLGLIGHPLGHSRSPQLHNAALAEARLNGVYLAFPTPPERLDGAIAGMRALGMRGLNVTIPHKVAVMQFLDGLTEVAARVGAVNTLFWEGNRLLGDNTDVAGFRAISESWVCSNSKCLVLGAGGSARAVACALGEMGVAEVAFFPRRAGAALTIGADFARVYELTRYFEVGAAEMEAKLQAADLLINTTPVGMAPQVEASPLEPSMLDALAPRAKVIDLIYQPENTALMLGARARGHEAINGAGMLIAQAAASFERWTGQRVPQAVWEGALQIGRI